LWHRILCTVSFSTRHWQLNGGDKFPRQYLQRRIAAGQCVYKKRTRVGTVDVPTATQEPALTRPSWEVFGLTHAAGHQVKLHLLMLVNLRLMRVVMLVTTT
jgi:hypothetical protein